MMPRHVDDIALRKILHDLHVAYQSRPGEIAFEQIVTQHGILGDAASDRRFEGIDVINALAGERAFAEKILVDIGYREYIRVESGAAGIYLLIECALAAAWKRDRHPRLHDSVTAGYPAGSGIEYWLVERVRQLAGQFSGGIARQQGIGVEHDDISYALRQIRGNIHKGCIRRPAEQPVEFVKLATLALPAHPHGFGGVPSAGAMQQHEPVVAVP